MPRLHVIICSTRPTRKGPAVANWFFELAKKHGKFDVELVDLKEVNLPVFDEPEHPRFGKYVHEHTKRWSAKVSEADAFAFVTPEYNYGSPPSLVNALNYLFKEWHYKPAAFVSYGGLSGGTRSVQMTKSILTTLKVMPLPDALNFPFFAKELDEATGVFKPPEKYEGNVAPVLDELLRWTNALKTLRT